MRQGGGANGTSFKYENSGIYANAMNWEPRVGSEGTSCTAVSKASDGHVGKDEGISAQ